MCKETLVINLGRIKKDNRDNLYPRLSHIRVPGGGRGWRILKSSFFDFSEWQMRNQHWTKWFPTDTERFSYQNCVQICRIPPYQISRNCVQICRIPFDTEWFSYQNCVQICPYPIEYSPKNSQLCELKRSVSKGNHFQGYLVRQFSLVKL